MPINLSLLCAGPEALRRYFKCNWTPQTAVWSKAGSCDKTNNQRAEPHVSLYFMFIEPCGFASFELSEEGIAPGCIGEAADGGNSSPTARRITGISCCWVATISWAIRRSCSLRPYLS